MPYEGQNRSPKSVTHNVASPASVFGPVNVAAGESVDTPLDVYTVPNDTKILKVGITALAISGAATVQIVVGNGAPNGTTGSKDVAQAAGDQVFTNPVAVDATGVNGGKGQTVSPAQRDAVYPAGTQLSLRAVTAAGNTVTGLRISAILAEQSATVSAGTPGDIGLAADVTP